MTPAAFKRIRIGDTLLVRGGGTRAIVVGFRKVRRDGAVIVRLENGTQSIFRYLDVSRLRTGPR